MKKKVLFAGAAGGMVMLTWLFVTNAVLPLKADLIHGVLPFQAQLEVHEALKKAVKGSGTYSIPYLSRAEEARFPDYRYQPVYTVIFQEYAHGDTDGGSVLSSFPVVLLAVFIPTFLAAWMLSMASPAVTSRYSRRFYFVVAIGVIIALYDDVLQVSFGPLAEDYLVFLAINHLMGWALTGLVMAGMMDPGIRTPSGTSA